MQNLVIQKDERSHIRFQLSSILCASPTLKLDIILNVSSIVLGWSWWWKKGRQWLRDLSTAYQLLIHSHLVREKCLKPFIPSIDTSLRPCIFPCFPICTQSYCCKLRSSAQSTIYSKPVTKASPMPSSSSFFFSSINPFSSTLSCSLASSSYSC